MDMDMDMDMDIDMDMEPRVAGNSVAHYHLSAVELQMRAYV